MGDYTTYRNKIQTALRAAGLCIFEVDILRQRYTFFENPEAIFGKNEQTILREIEPFCALPEKEYQEKISEYFSHPDDAETINRAFQAVFSGSSYVYEARMKAGDSAFNWCLLHVTPVFENGAVRTMVGVISNIQNTKEKLLKLEDSVQLDSFTGLCSKQRFIELTDMILSENPERRCAMLVIDLDHFKAVNDTYGHMCGDEILLAISGHIRSLFRKSDIVARFGGDEFVILMLDADSDAAVGRATKFLHQPDNRFGVTKSVGIALRTPEDTGFRSLFQKADQALYTAKETRDTYVVYAKGQMRALYRPTEY